MISEAEGEAMKSTNAPPMITAEAELADRSNPTWLFLSSGSNFQNKMAITTINTVHLNILFSLHVDLFLIINKNSGQRESVYYVKHQFQECPERLIVTRFTSSISTTAAPIRKRARKIIILKLHRISWITLQKLWQSAIELIVLQVPVHKEGSRVNKCISESFFEKKHSQFL
jgi:hypothetical protein